LTAKCNHEQEILAVCESSDFSEYTTMGYNVISSSDVPASLQSSEHKQPVLSTLHVNTPIKRNPTPCATVRENKLGSLFDVTHSSELELIDISSLVRVLEAKCELSEKS
jgi:hypothetical protein